MKTTRNLILICLLALGVRLALGVAFVRYPAIADSNHYYNMGVRLVEGQGFTIDYIWQYNRPPEAVVHPEDHWMPLAAVLAAIPMGALGISTGASLVLFVLIGSLLPLIAYWGARQLKLQESSAYYAALAAALMPELVLNSLRTDTTVPTALFVCLSLLLLNEGLWRGGWWHFAVSGAMVGLAYLTRNDGLLLIPMLAAVLIAYVLVRRGRAKVPLHWRGVVVWAAAMLLVMTPWLIRNWQEFGAFGSAETDDMFFFTDHNDHYAYGRHFTLDTMLAAQTPAQIIGKRLFEMAAGIKVMITGLGEVIAVGLVGGVAYLWMKRREDPKRMLAALPVIVLLVGAFVAYTVFIPYKAQAGSFKKAFLMTAPLLIPVAALAIEQAIPHLRWRYGVMGLSLVILAAFAFDLVRLDNAGAAAYYPRIQAAAEQAETMPDTNGDGQIILMTQDPYALSYAGISSLMFPFENLDTTYEIARRYGVDYLLMPSARPGIDVLLNGETDPRFNLVGSVAGTEYTFWRVEPE